MSILVWHILFFMEYRVDLLFLHRRLRSMVAIELKIGSARCKQAYWCG